MNNLLLQEEELKADPGIPSEEEKKKLKEIYDYLRVSEIKMLFMLYPTLILIIISYFLDEHTLAIFIIVMYAVIMLVGILYLMVKRELIKKCPRCSMRKIPPTSDTPGRGNCPRCGLNLDISDEKQKDKVI